jgi:hypothetical protein
MTIRLSNHEASLSEYDAAVEWAEASGLDLSDEEIVDAFNDAIDDATDWEAIAEDRASGKMR